LPIGGVVVSSRFRVVLVDFDEDIFSPQGWEREMLAGAGAELVIGQHRSQEAMLDAVAGADIVMLQSVRPLMPRAVIERLGGCRGIVKVSIGYDNVDLSACTEMDIPLCNVPEYCVHEVADHALALLLASVRHLGRQDRWVRSGRWDRTGAKPARRLSGQTLGLVGFGRTGRALVEKARGLGFNFLAADPYAGREVARGFGVELVGLEEMLQRSDMISVHAPLTPETHHLLGPREFEILKPGAVIVNTSRGPIIDQAALVEALRDGRVLAAGLDVFEREPIEAASQLLAMDNVILTPHTAGYSEQAVGDLYRSACDTAVQLLDGVWPSTAVNPVIRDRWLARWSTMEGLQR
jgi:D-3-phosphoglycerate dehydrogenase / 2-oxoglutarate reductase